MTDIAYQPPSPGAPAPARDATAVMGRRILAWVLDVLLYLGVAIALFATFAEYVDVSTLSEAADACEVVQSSNESAEVGSCLDVSDIPISGAEDRVWVTSESETAVQTLGSIGYLAFFVILQGLTGGSPGKLLTGLRVVDEQGRRAGVGRSFVRTLLWVVDAAPWIVPLVGFIVGLTSTGHRRVGDMVAKTYVVSAGDRGRPVVASQGAVPPGVQPWGSPPPATGWSPPTQPPASPAPPPQEPAAWSRPAPPSASPPPAPGEPVDPAVPESVVPDISGVPGDTPAPPTISGISQDPTGDDGASGPEPPPPVDYGPTAESAAPADEAPPDVGVDPEWWSGPEASPDPTDAGAETASAPESAEPDPITWDDPSEEPTTVGDTADEGWSPPTTPNADFGTTDDASPTAGPTPFVAPGTDARAESPSTPQVNPTPPPQWDQARNTYIQWDPNQQMWLQWDTVANRWKIIDT